ncbi:MAG: amidohydrolase family protein [Desulfarculus sp.]|nr:amidohydrolase family protein [Desulfarculus sp.]
MPVVYVKNVGLMLSGEVAAPILEADSLVIADGLIKEVGRGLNCPAGATVIDAGGAALLPGLIDSHCHVVLMDYSPRQKTIGFLDSALHGGVTTSISAGEVHLDGRPKDRAGVKALAVLAAKSFANYRPGGMKVLGGAVILEKSLELSDFAELYAEGVRVVGEVGLGSVKEPKDAAPMVRAAQAAGLTVMMHTGGTSIPGSSTVTAEQVMAIGPDVVSHINGGPTAISLEEARRLVQETTLTLEIVHCGNPLRAVQVCQMIEERRDYARIIVGNDAPSGTGIVPLGILRTMNLMASLGGLAPEVVVAMATGNTARRYGLNRGVIAPGREADLVFADASMGSAGADFLAGLAEGDNPGVSIVMVDGQVITTKSRNTPPPKRAAKVVG